MKVTPGFVKNSRKRENDCFVYITGAFIAVIFALSVLVVAHSGNEPVWLLVASVSVIPAGTFILFITKLWLRRH